MLLRPAVCYRKHLNVKSQYLPIDWIYIHGTFSVVWICVQGVYVRPAALLSKPLSG